MAILNDTTPTFSGTGTAGDVISVYLDGNTTPLGTTTVGADGTGALRRLMPINPDSYRLPSPQPIRQATSASRRQPSP